MTPSFVVDTSVAMAWCFLDEATPATKELLRQMEETCAAVPGLWFLEIANLLLLAERRRRIEPARVAEFIALVEGFDLEVMNDAPDRAFSHLLPLCRTHGLTTYDAAYLDLAMRSRLPLASLDDDLRGAATQLGIRLLGK